MQSIASYIPGLVRKIGVSLSFPSQDSDTIKFIRFEKLSYKPNALSLSILIGYERGFEIWDITSDPLLLYSKRNQGISLISYIPNSHSLHFALVSLYDTADFPISSFRIISVIENKTLEQIKTEFPVIGLQSNFLITAIAMLYKIDIYENSTYNKMYSVNVNNSELRFTLANVYIAYTVAYRQDNAEEVEIKLADMISKTVHNIAESGINKIKNYIDPNLQSSYYGKIWIKNIMMNSVICEIQAFNSAVSVMEFSKSSHFLVVSPLSGLVFHIYRINPTKETRGDSKNRYFLLYQLHRGVTPAEINDIAISDDEKIVIVSSARGTCHVYMINPESTTLSYNHEVYCRIKLGSLLENLVHPKCFIQSSKKTQVKSKSPLQNAILEPCPGEVTIITSLGSITKYTIEPSPVLISSNTISRHKDFKEQELIIPPMNIKKNPISTIECAEITYSGWLPLCRCPQFNFYSTTQTYQQSLIDGMELQAFNEEKLIPGFTVHYEKTSRLQEAMDNKIPSTQVVHNEIDHQFIEKGTPIFKLYLNEHFSK